MEVTQRVLLVQLVLRLLQLAQHLPPCALFVLLVSTYLAQLALIAPLGQLALRDEHLLALHVQMDRLQSLAQPLVHLVPQEPQELVAHVLSAVAASFPLQEQRRVVTAPLDITVQPQQEALRLVGQLHSAEANVLPVRILLQVNHRALIVLLDIIVIHLARHLA